MRICDRKAFGNDLKFFAFFVCFAVQLLCWGAARYGLWVFISAR